MLPFATEFVACHEVPLVAGSATALSAPVVLSKRRGEIAVPRKTRDRKPVYPQAAIQAGISGLVIIESELTTRQAELDSLTQQRDALVDQVDYSTITVELVTQGVAPDPLPDDFWSGVMAGWSALLGFATWLGVAVGVLLPWVLAGLVIGAIVLVIVVLATRGRRSKPTTTETTPRA